MGDAPQPGRVRAALLRLWAQWAADAGRAHAGYTQWQLTLTSRLEARVPPPEYAADHQQLIRLSEDRGRLRVQRSTDPVDVRAMTSSHAAMRELVAKLAAAAVSDDQRDYATELDRLFLEGDERYAHYAAQSELATKDAIRALAGVRAPADAAAEHAALGAVLEGQLAVARAFHAASQAAEPERVADAAARWVASLEDIRAAMQRIAEQVGYAVRWPARRSGD